MKTVKLAWPVLLTVLLSACSLTPPAYDAQQRESVDAAMAAFKEDTRLAPFFEQAVAIAVLPRAVRGGTGFGGAWGGGWLLQDGQALGKVALKEGFAGANMGLQFYRQIIFFKTDKALSEFLEGGLQFTGQANAAATIVGKSYTPAFNTQVAVFAQVRAGLLLEASVGAQHYQFYPL